MNDETAFSPDAGIAEAAARWTVRRDRGLSSTESIEYELWLAADPRHGVAMARLGGAWARLDRIPDEAAVRTLTAAARRRQVWRRVGWAGAFAAAASLAVVVWRGAVKLSSPRTEAPAGAMLQAAGPRLVALADGSEVRLNAGGEIAEQFTPRERRVLVVRGEAHFTVVKDAARPFVVSAGSVRVRAIGTAFNVNLTTARVAVLVTEGTVGLERATASSGAVAMPAAPDHSPVRLVAGQQGVVSEMPPVTGRVAPAIAVTTLPPADIAVALAWQKDLLRLGGATLAEIVAEFERRTRLRVILGDPALGQLRLGGRIRADDADGFAAAIATALELEVERTPDGALVLRRKNPDLR